MFIVMVVAVMAVACGNAEITETLDTETSETTERTETSETTEALAAETENSGSNSQIIEGKFYLIEGPDGSPAMGCEITNNATENVSSGLTVAFKNEYGESLGVSSAYIPCIASGETAFIYVTNDYLDYSNVDHDPHCLTENTWMESAKDDLGDFRIIEEENCLHCVATNTSTETAELPQITIVYTFNTIPVAVRKEMLAEKGAENCLLLQGGHTGEAFISYPNKQFDNYICYITAFREGDYPSTYSY